jgi:hypothetical protein
MKKIIIILFLVLASNSVFSYSPNFSEINYYDQIIDIGLSDINYPEETTVKISIYGITEKYYDNSFLISEIEYIPIIFSKEIPGILEVIYEFKDISGNIIDKKTFSLVLKNPEIPNFYLCNLDNCTGSITEFWKNEDLFLTVDAFNSNLEYSIAIETDNSLESKVLFQDKNITFPYAIPKNLILGHYQYKLIINIFDKEKNNKFQKELNFILVDITKEEYSKLTDYMLYSEENKGISEEDIELTESNNEEIETKSSNLKYYLVFAFVIIIILSIFLIPKRRRRYHEKK